MKISTHNLMLDTLKASKNSFKWENTNSASQRLSSFLFPIQSAQHLVMRLCFPLKHGGWMKHFLSQLARKHVQCVQYMTGQVQQPFLLRFSETSFLLIICCSQCSLDWFKHFLYALLMLFKNGTFYL